MVVRIYLDFDPETKFWVHEKFFRSRCQLSEAEMKRSKKFKRLRLFLKKGEGVSAAQPNNEPVLKAENKSLIVDESDRSMDLEDLIEKDRILSELLEKTEAENWALTQQFAEMLYFQAQLLTKLRAYYHFNTMSIPCRRQRSPLMSQSPYRMTAY